MASKASIDKFRAIYKDTIERFSAVADTFVPLMEADEATLKALLRDLPKAAKEDPSIKRLLFSMKDKARAAKKILRALGRKTEIGRDPWVTKNADIKLLRKMLKDQDHLLAELGRNAVAVFDGKIAMMKFAEKHLGWKSKGLIKMMEQRASNPRWSSLR